MSGIVISATLQGHEATLRKFRSLDGAVSGDVTKRATRKGVTVQRRGAKQTTRFRDRTGRLRRAIGLSVRQKKRQGLTIGRVLVRTKGGAFYANPVEFGHRIAVSRRSGVAEKGHVFFRDRRGKSRKRKFGHVEAVSGGTVAPRNYMRDAFAATVGSAEAEFTREFVAGVNREVARG